MRWMPIPTSMRSTSIYAEYIISTVERIKETCPHPLVMVEKRLDYSYLVPQGFGTGDCVIIADGTLYVMDYKSGKGVFVSCDHNPQMMLFPEIQCGWFAPW